MINLQNTSCKLKRTEFLANPFSFPQQKQKQSRKHKQKKPWNCSMKSAVWFGGKCCVGLLFYHKYCVVHLFEVMWGMIHNLHRHRHRERNTAEDYWYWPKQKKKKNPHHVEYIEYQYSFLTNTHSYILSMLDELSINNSYDTASDVIAYSHNWISRSYSFSHVGWGGVTRYCCGFSIQSSFCIEI